MVSMLESDPDAVAKLLEAANANDTEAFLATFVDGGVVDDWGREFVGTDASEDGATASSSASMSASTSAASNATARRPW
jgi:hypothetical protein